VLAVPGGRAGLIPARPDPPIGIADDRQRRAATVFVPPGALLCCFTDGLVERRDQPIYHGIGKVAAILDEQIAVGTRRGAGAGSMAEDACAAVMRALVGNVPAQDDIAVLILSRHP
jgi:phosphoserine phosphatase RsbU/P